MKRGINRIIAGSIMILLQILIIIALSPKDYYYGYGAGYSAGFNTGFISIGIIGVILLIFGIRAYSKELRSRLILHTRGGKSHTMVKWIAFVATMLLLGWYLYYFIYSLTGNTVLNTGMFLSIFATLSFALYLLFYLYKKPCCLLSTSLLFLGINYIYNLIGNMYYYLLYLPNDDFYMTTVIFYIIPSLIAAILYIALASILYKETFSVKTIRVISWIIFAMEFSRMILYSILVGSSLKQYFVDIPYIIFIISLFLYTGVFKINTLKIKTVKETTNFSNFTVCIYDTVTNEIRKEERPVDINKLPFEKYAVDGIYYAIEKMNNHKKERVYCSKSIWESHIDNQIYKKDEIKFCRKCGFKLIDGSEFCSNCGTKIINNMEMK